LQFDDGETPAASLAAATPTTKSDQSLPWVADSQALIDPANLAAETGSFMHHLDRLNPSNADDAPSPLAARDDPRRFLRGQLIHKLLQILPNLPPHQRDQAAKDFLANRAGELEVGAADEIAASVRAVLDHPDFAPLFGPGSYAELGVAGYTADGRLVSGQIDRLLITPGDIWIIDYKTNRPPPTSPDQVPAAYRQQVALYAALLQDIYPNRPVHSALLWTEGPTLMPLEPTKRLEKS
jgi:ATP-dependent helicase/nuclease subunit A